MKKRYPAILDLNIHNNIDFESIQKQDPVVGNNIKDDVINEAYKAIEYGIKANKQKAEIFEIYNTRAILNIPKKTWKNTLNNIILPYYIEKEEYTICCNIRDLISQIK